jgi:hypothetical protein
MPPDLGRNEGVLSRTDGVVGYTPIGEVAPSLSGLPDGRVDDMKPVSDMKQAWSAPVQQRRQDRPLVGTPTRRAPDAAKLGAPRTAFVLAGGADTQPALAARAS